MLDSILEHRVLRDGLYDISLIMNENDYFMVYDNISNENATEIMDNYLVRRQDDGRPDGVQIKHNKNRHIVSINASLHYTENDKTTYTMRPHGYLNNDVE
ncbi:MAG TPA: hypothetical protein VFD89_01385 [Clostridia bacterium]|nr:hypothetical protein [Clostridia bacterium]